MTPLAVAKRLAEGEPHHGGWACLYCEMPDGCHSGFRDTHHDDCPWLSLPAIIAALEAAERYLRAGTSQNWYEAALAFGLIELRNTERGRVYVAVTEDGALVAPTQGEKGTA